MSENSAYLLTSVESIHADRRYQVLLAEMNTRADLSLCCCRPVGTFLRPVWVSVGSVRFLQR